MVDIRVIVPAYNAEKYIRKCLDSLLCQTKKDIEIIAVNDGSKDCTLDILNEYSEKYPSIVKVISQENQGLSITRNNGIKIAEGKYIAFVDSDDYVKPNMLEKLYNKAIEGDYDVVCSDVDCIYPNKVLSVSSGINFETDALSIEQKKILLLNLYVVVWNKLYKKEVFTKDVMFEPGIWFEDVLFLHKIVPNLNKISFVNESFYQYLQNTSSITYTYSEKLKDINVMLDKVVEYYKEKGFYDTYRDELEYMYARYMLATFVKRLSKSKDKKRFNEGVEYALERVKTAFPEYKKNKYLKKGLKNLYIRFFNKHLANIIFILEKNRMN
jgi:glycosyltransferase involved in cell wall biosynthesis